MNNVSVVTEVQAYVVAAGEQGPPGRTGLQGGSPTDMYLFAQEALSGHRMVMAGNTHKATYASNNDLTSAGRVIGMTAGAVAADDSVQVLREQEIYEPSWSWSIGLPIYLGLNGLITQVPPTAPASFSLCVGFATASDRMFIKVGSPIILS